PDHPRDRPRPSPAAAARLRALPPQRGRPRGLPRAPARGRLRDARGGLRHVLPRRRARGRAHAPLPLARGGGHRRVRRGRMSAGVLRVGYGSSPEYLPHVAASLHSVLANRGALAVEAHYLHGPALPAADRQSLRAMVEREGATIVLHEIADERIADLPDRR